MTALTQLPQLPQVTQAFENCPKCDPMNPELDESGCAYTCYFCCNTGRVPQAQAQAYWQDLQDSIEYQPLRPVVNGKHQRLDGDEYDSWYVALPLLPASIFPKPARVTGWAHVDNGTDDIPF